MSSRLAAIALSLALVALGCAAVPTPVVMNAPASGSPLAGGTAATTAPVACPSSTASPMATSPFTDETFEHDESRGIARAWLAGLARLYAGDPTMDPCTIFTPSGLVAARAADARLRAALDGERTTAAQLDLRVAFEGAHDLRVVPVMLPLDVIFDLAAGAIETDHRSSTRTITVDAQRAGFGVTFLFDGSTWRADDAGPVSAENLRWSTMPTPVPADPCTGLRRDPAGAPFDERAATPFEAQGDDPRGGRAWCDTLDGGRLVRQPDQLVLLTRFPCDRGTIAVLQVGNPVGAPLDPLVGHEFMRDPAGEALDAGWIEQPWEADTELPADAASTGWSNGNIELWVSPSRFEDGVYVRLGDAFEWWPRTSPDGWGVTDCN